LAEQDPIQPGSRFGGTSGTRFLVEKQVGRGGQAVVFLVRDTRLDRLVALKLCTAPDGHLRKMFLDRFERELKLTSRVSHPHVLQVFDAGELSGGSPYVLLEYMHHGSLVDLASKARGGQRIPLSYMRYYATALAAALRASHAADVIHRDVKPDNVLIARDGVAKLTDFGVALDIAPDAERLTEIGQTVGTLGFMAPEQLGGLPGPQSDIFSFGITLYALLIGRVPPQEETSNRIPTGVIFPEAWEAVPKGLHRLFHGCCAYTLEARAKSFDEVLGLIERADWSELTGHHLPEGELPPLPTGAYVSGQTGVLQSDFSMAAKALYGDSDPAHAAATGAFAETLDLTVHPPVEALAGGDAVGEDTEPGPTRPQQDTARSVAPATGPAPAPAAGAAEPSADSQPPADAAPSPDHTPTRMMADTSPDRDGGRGPMGGIAVGAGIVLVAFVAVVAFVLTRPAPLPDDATLEGAIQSLEGAAMSGDATRGGTTGVSFAAVPEDDPRRRLLVGIDAVLAGHAEAAREAVSGLPDADPGAMGSHAALVLGAAERLAGPDGYAVAVASYARARQCTGDGCGALAERAARATAEACLVAPAGTMGCGTPTLSGRAAGFAAAAVLLSDGHAAAADERIGAALALPPDADACAEVTLLRRLDEIPGIGSTHRPALADAGRAAARSTTDCSLFLEGTP